MSATRYILAIFLCLLFVKSAESGEIYKFESKTGTNSYSNLKSNKSDSEKVEIISSKKSSIPSNSENVINYQIENLFNDSINRESELVTKLRAERADLVQLLVLYEQQREDLQFDLNANTVTLERCLINPVYDYLILFCSGLENKQQRILDELDIVTNQIERLRFQVSNIDQEIGSYINQSGAVACEVTKVLRGDTFECTFSTGTRVVKLIGIETPDENERLESTPSNFTETLILGKRVVLTFDGQKTDSSNRLLAYAFLNDETMLNALLLRQGYGFAIANSPYRFVNEFRRYENLARESNVGIWAN